MSKLEVQGWNSLRLYRAKLRLKKKGQVEAKKGAKLRLMRAKLKLIQAKLRLKWANLNLKRANFLISPKSPTRCV